MQRCGTLAAALLSAHFAAVSSLETEGLAALRRIAAALAPADGAPPAAAAAAAFQELIDLLVDGDRVSAFELHASAALPAIIAYISAADVAADDAAALARLQVRLLSCSLLVAVGTADMTADDAAALARLQVRMLSCSCLLAVGTAALARLQHFAGATVLASGDLIPSLEARASNDVFRPRSSPLTRPLPASASAHSPSASGLHGSHRWNQAGSRLRPVFRLARLVQVASRRRSGAGSLARASGTAGRALLRAPRRAQARLGPRVGGRVRAAREAAPRV